MLEQLISLRKELHRFPELSGHEKETAQRIKSFLLPFQPSKIIENIGGHGLVAVFEYSNDGITIAIRCELDALPIQERNDFDYQSTQKGVSHKCGHDGHMVMVAGLAGFLQTSSFQKGKVILLFQPAEENGQGAKAMLDDPKFKELQPDYIFALHNLPSYEMHEIVAFPNQFSPTVQSVAISLTGKTAHAAEPENGNNPALAIANIIQLAQTLEQTNPLEQNFALLTPVYIQLGQKDYGISAGKGEVHFTIRAWQLSKMDELVAALKSNIEGFCKKYSLTVEYDWFDYFPTVKNDEECNQIIQSAALDNDLKLTIPAHGCKFGEDFGWFSQRFKGAIFGLGSGKNCPALHHDNYDFSDELIETGLNIFKKIISIINSYDE